MAGLDTEKAAGGERRPGRRASGWSRRPAPSGAGKRATPPSIELLLNEVDAEWFRFSRDRSVTVPRGRLSFRHGSGLPVLASEAVLLYKSNSPEGYDADFRNAAPSRAEESRDWLKGALKKLFVWHPRADRL